MNHIFIALWLRRRGCSGRCGAAGSATVQQADARRSYDVQSVRLDNLNERQQIADASIAKACCPGRWRQGVALFEPKAAK